MVIKFKNPPVNELIISTYFNPILQNLRSEHVGLFWSTLKDQFPFIAQNVPVGNLELIAGLEVFPMPRFWLTSHDDTTLIQIQKNAFMFNWRKRDLEYPHFDSLKVAFDGYYTQFTDFLKREIDIVNPNIDICELTYINLVETCEYWQSPVDTQNVIPSFSIINFDQPSIDQPSFNCNSVYKMSENLEIRISVKSAHLANKPDSPALVFEIRAIGRLGEAQKSDADRWFEKAHAAIINCFVGMTNPDIQHKYWILNGSDAS